MKWTEVAQYFIFGTGRKEDSMRHVIIDLMAVFLSTAGFGSSPYRVAQEMPEFQKAWQGAREFFAGGLKKHGIVGSSLMFMRDNRVLALDVQGMANIEKEQKVDRNTIYHWASITKTFTGIAIMQLRDRGLLRLEDPIVKYLPELRAVRDPYGDISEITIRHLMSHSAGFRGATWPWGGDMEWQPHEPQYWSQLVAMMPYTEVLFRPGTKYSYSNPGIIFLGRVIEELTLDDYEVYVDKNILKPLEMYRTYFDTTPYHLLKDRSHSYYLRDGQRAPARFDVNTGITVSNGGLNSPFDDMAKYLNFLVGDPANQARYDQVLKRASLEEMFRPQVEVERRDQEKEVDSMGLLFFLERHGGMDFVAHSGGQNGFISHFYIHMPSRAAYLVAFNTEATTGEKQDPPNTRVLDRDLRDYLIKNVFRIFAGSGHAPPQR
jgi:CubicO group peptidase (beta-lactamase class C family)